jgi:hypothetical protein
MNDRLLGQVEEAQQRAAEERQKREGERYVHMLGCVRNGTWNLASGGISDGFAARERVWCWTL